MSRRSNDEPLHLLSQGEEVDTKQINHDIEAGARHSEPSRDQNLDHEYSIPSTIKFTWLGTYFFFSLLLTLYNKLVLGMVSLIPCNCGSSRIAVPLNALVANACANQRI